MDRKLINKIKGQKESPLIAVIGATNPTIDYKNEMGVEVGYYLRDFIDSRKGNIFTGGVDGVGVDVYTGVVKYCFDKKINKSIKDRVDDRFFVLIPHYMGLMPNQNLLGEEISYELPYNPPSAYEALRILNGKKKLDNFIVGIDMNERREYLTEIADIMVVVNGGNGTIDEALKGLKNNKPVISLFETGGAAGILKNIKDNVSFTKSLFSSLEVPVFDFRKDLHLAKDINEVIGILEKLV